MFKNFIITTWRSLIRNKVNAVINIIGLAISIACCISIYVFVMHERSFDNFHLKGDRIYRIVMDDVQGEKADYNGYVPFALAKALRNDFPQLETVTQVYGNNQVVVAIPGENNSRKLFEENQATYADEYFLKTFDFEKIAGDDQLLQKPDEVVLTKKLADKYYGTQSPNGYAALIGKSIIIDKNSYRISAILKDIPRNSNLACHMLLPYKVFERNNPYLVGNWKDLWSEAYTFVTLPSSYSKAQFDASLVSFKNKYLTPEDARHHTYHPQALATVHSDGKYGGTYYTSPGILMLAFVIMGVIILLTSCINFINLAIVQSLKRAKEIGIRKTLGSSKAAIIFRFMCETLVLIIIASVIGVFIAKYCLQAFNNYLLFIVELDLHIDSTVIIFLIVLAFIITFLAGFYPAKVMSSFRPIQVLKHSIKAKHTGFSNKFSLRKFLVITQFTVSQVLIIGTLVVATQMSYFQKRDLGYEKESIYMVEIPENNQLKFQQMRNTLMQDPQIKDISFNSGPPTSASNGFTSMRKREDPVKANFSVERKYVDDHYLSTFNIKLLAGRELLASDKVQLRDTTPNYNILLNRKATLALGYKTPGDAIGQQVAVQDKEFATIVGVTDDFFNVSLQKSIEPCILFYGTNWAGMECVRLAKNPSEKTYAAIENTWKATFPDQVYKGMTLNYYIDHKAFYIIEDIMYQGFKVFVVLALLIGCMGLYGLVAFLALQRQKEIGIRKVLGASVSGIVYLFSKEFATLVIISFLIAAPLGYFAMHSWLQTFANRIDLTAWYFIIAFIISLAIAAITVGSQALKAAIANPVKSLRSE